jgi:hypothetical protein
VPPGDWAFRITLREMKSASIVVRMVCHPSYQPMTANSLSLCACRSMTLFMTLSPQTTPPTRLAHVLYT